MSQDQRTQDVHERQVATDMLSLVDAILTPQRRSYFAELMEQTEWDVVILWSVIEAREHGIKPPPEAVAIASDLAGVEPDQLVA